MVKSSHFGIKLKEKTKYGFPSENLCAVITCCPRQRRIMSYINKNNNNIHILDSRKKQSLMLKQKTKHHQVVFNSFKFISIGKDVWMEYRGGFPGRISLKQITACVS